MRRFPALLLAFALTAPVWAQTPVMPPDYTLHNAESFYAAPWIPLFDGQTLNGWKTVGGGKWTVQNGCIVGETGDGSYGWLCTERPYADFFLELQFKIEAPGNSGIQFRSHVIGPDEKMYGYQAECDPQIGKFTGGIYEEHGRGWLAQPSIDTERAAIKPGEWNEYRISMIDNHIETLINGVKCVDFVDEEYQCRSGIIALQVHSGTTQPVKVRWKDIRIQDYGYGRGWTQLFNGRDLSNWNIQGEEPWIVEDGTIMGRNGKKGGNGYIATKDTYADFVVRAKYRVEGEGNSGVFFRSKFKGADVTGVQSEIDYRPEHNPTGLYESGRRNWIAIPREEAQIVFNPSAWNDIIVEARGPHIRTWLNGFKMVDFVDKELFHTDGQIALQVHSGETCKVRFRDVAVIRFR